MSGIQMKGCLGCAWNIPAPILGVGFFRLNFYDIHVRYRLMVEFQDGDQVKTGSSTTQMEVSWDSPAAAR
ncbi:hypothetical protein [Bradyrhizobium sp. Arg816]|uniref:hypothetical protein n=1 Tax=Bradyrhizobium sp. Arg816 TaxID=2998491 RepID=UPI00249E2557|nr:hypothetical protein [Bradyrhizobium sp. Arg816]MDI3561135.1 hypothetical protein [Bradyrhizobium sp. Arg816]